MKKIHNSLSHIVFPAWTVPAAIFLLGALSYGLVLSRLGYFQDDWHHIYALASGGTQSLQELLLHDTRPFAVWPYRLLFPILGFNPAAWQVSTLLLHISTVLVFWLLLRLIWPDHARQTAWISLLLVIYPLYNLQPLSVAYTLHWASYLVFAASLYLMALALRKPPLKNLLTAGSLLLCALHLFTIEYFSGAELARPVILYLLLAAHEDRRGYNIKKAVKIWLPYAAVLAGFIIWRQYLIEIPEDIALRNDPILFSQLLSNPAAALGKLLLGALQDSLIILFTVWYPVLQPEILSIADSATGLMLAMMTVTGACAYFFLTHSPALDTESKIAWRRQALGLGLAVLLTGPIPAWAVGQQLMIRNPLWSSRLGMASMLGAAILIVALLETLIENLRYRTIIFVILVSLALGWHINNGNQFRWAWTKQSRFYQQLYWRAPFIKPGTSIISADDELFEYMGYYPTSFALNTLYLNAGKDGVMRYWFFGLNKHFGSTLHKFLANEPISGGKLSGEFYGEPANSLLISFQPENNQCLWVLRPEDALLRVLADNTREAAPLSNPGRILQASPDSSYQTPHGIFQTEPDGSWCYTYQKADLARQYSSWEQVARLWDQALKLDIRPKNGVEFLPFIEAFARLQDWEAAFDLTRQANRLTPGMAPALCAIWTEVGGLSPASPTKDTAVTEFHDLIDCP